MAEWSREVFAKNLQYYMKVNDKNQKELASIVGVSAPTVNDWINAKKYPRIDKIEKLADYFGCLKSDLIEEQTEETRKAKKDSQEIAALTVRMKNDDDFLQSVKAINEMEPDKLKNLLALIK